MFQTYRWPGNVRELRNAVRRLVVVPDRTLVYETGPAAVPSSVAETPIDRAATISDLHPLQEARRFAADAFERGYLLQILEVSQGNVTRAANLAGVSRQVIHKLIAKHGLEREPRGLVALR
ncbi:MAG TPA: helix-turn-helix domain-containing protein, partial [Polyangia bacterium]